MVLRWHHAVVCAGPPRDMALMIPGVEELHEATKRPHYASQAEATPRVDVGEVSQASGNNAARSIKDRNPCTKGGSNKRCFFVIDLSGKTLTTTTFLGSSVSSLEHHVSSMTGVPADKFYLVVNGGRLDPDLSLSQNGIDKDVSVRMCFRLKGGVRQEVPGSWTCNICNWEGAGQFVRTASDVGLLVVRDRLVPQVVKNGIRVVMRILLVAVAILLSDVNSHNLVPWDRNPLLLRPCLSIPLSNLMPPLYCNYCSPWV